jgi:protein involved in polysaccharide export with SLBB domain
MLKQTTNRTEIVHTHGILQAAILLLLGWWTCGWIGGVANAQAQQAKPEYQIRPGDMLSVIVLRHPEMSAEQIIVSSAGKISLPVIGKMLVSGKTIKEVDTAITDRLYIRLRRPEVTVTLKHIGPVQVFVQGMVRKPGAHAFKPGWRVSDALAAAGGLSLPADEVEVTLSRPYQKTILLDLAKILADVSQSANLALEPDDSLRFVPKIIKGLVFISGEVQKEGGYEIAEGDSISQLIAKAGGPTEIAALKGVVVQRNGKTHPVDVYSAMKNGTPVNFPLQEGDYVVVPRNPQRVLVMPGVNKPGYYSMPEDGSKFTVADALKAAGGVKGNLRDYKEIWIVRQTPSGTTKQAIPLDKVHKGEQSLEEVLSQPLQSGDVVYVPELQGSEGARIFAPRIFGF